MREDSCLRRYHFLVFLLVAFFLGASPRGHCSDEAIPGFNRDIRPLLAKHCFACHGPDAAKRKADLRLDDREVAVSAGAIKPGHVQDSEIWRRLTSTDQEAIMPPPGKGEPMPKEGMEKVRKWIESGAGYERHWSFIPPRDPTIPDVAAPGFLVRSPVDSLVLDSLIQKGLAPAPEASRERWIRRVTFDLTGLPPTTEEVASFLADRHSGAYETVVDRLLASQAFGERMAADWLDLARYGDTYGQHEDQNCFTWPWRDWVIRAFNRNLPYDQFLLLQTAGDLVPGAGKEGTIATAFNRLHVMTNEAGTNPEESRCEGIADRVKTVGTAFLGLTLECARCHDHKFDPIPTREYYAMSSFFDNIDELGAFTSLSGGVPGPSLTIFAEDAEIRHAELVAEIRRKETERDSQLPLARARFENWLKKQRPPELVKQEPSRWSGLWSRVFPPRPPAEWAAPVDSYNFDDFTDRRHLPNQMKADSPALSSRSAKHVKGFGGGAALRFTDGYTVELTGAGDFSRSDPFSLSLWIKLDKPLEEGVVIHRTRGAWDAGNRGYEISIENNRPVAKLSYFWPGNAIGLGGKDALPVGKWTHLALTYDGSSKASGAALYVDGRSDRVEILQDHLTRDFRYYQEWGDFDEEQVPDSKQIEHPQLTLAGRLLGKLFLNGAIDQVDVFDRDLTPPEIAKLAHQVKEFPEADWFAWYLREIDQDWRSRTDELRHLRQAEDTLVKDAVELMVMREKSPRRQSHVLERGAFNRPKEAVEPGVPSAVLPFSDDLPRNRLGLARWLLHPDQPLTARVEVNRLWQMFFGTGIVSTSEDFGAQGEAPSHPELLDWLACHFRSTGWDVKSLCRLIVLSSTYRQDSLPGDPSLLVSDPDNRLLARGPKIRLTAEELRDQALALSGLLTRRVGGRSAMPYQPAGYWEESGTQHVYQQGTGEGLFRRSLYTFWRRTMPPPNMQVFDAPSREFCVSRRSRTSNPLQALTLLNDPLFVESACLAAERLVAHYPGNDPASDTGRCRDAFQSMTGREATPEETELLVKLLADTRIHWESHPGEAEALRDQAGDAPVNSRLSSVEVAATAIVIRTLFSYDEVTHKL